MVGATGLGTEATVAAVTVVVGAAEVVEVDVAPLRRARSAASRAGEPSGAVVGAAVGAGVVVASEAWVTVVVMTVEQVPRSAASRSADPSRAPSASVWRGPRQARQT